jgi:hypothetical protein
MPAQTRILTAKGRCVQAEHTSKLGGEVLGLAEGAGARPAPAPEPTCTATKPAADTHGRLSAVTDV